MAGVLALLYYQGALSLRQKIYAIEDLPPMKGHRHNRQQIFLPLVEIEVGRGAIFLRTLPAAPA